MPSKLEHKDVATEFEKCGLELLSPYYNSTSKMKYRCKCGGVDEVTYSSFCGRRHKDNCSMCRNTEASEVADDFVKHGHQLLSVYKDSDSDLEYRCQCGNIDVVTYSNFKQRRNKVSCTKCRKIGRISIYSYKDVVDFFSETECELLSDSFQNTNQKLEFRCKCGNLGRKGFLHFKNTPMCKDCGNKQATQKTKLDVDDFLARAKETHGNFYDYSKVVFTEWGKSVEIVCPDHGSFFQSPLQHTTCSHGCTQCGIEKTRQSQIKHDDWKTTEKIIKDAIHILGGKFPTLQNVQKHGLWDANRVILKLGGYTAARDKFGFDPIQKPKDYWKDIENVKKEIQENFPMMYESGVMPTSQMLRDVGAMDSPIRNHHGPLAEVAQKLGLEIATRWVTRDNHVVISYAELLLDEYLYSREIPHEPEVEVGRYRCDQKVGDYYIEIWGYPQRKHPTLDPYNERRKKKEAFYKKNKLNLIGIEGRLLQRGRIEEIEAYLDDLFSSLGCDVSKKHEFSFDVIHKNSGYRWNEKLVAEKLQEIWAKYGEFPTQSFIKKHKKKDANLKGINDVVQIFGGWPYFRDKMGVGKWVKPDRKWSEKEIVSRLKELCKKLGRFPKDAELPSDLRNAMRNSSHVESHDLNYYREKLGYEITKKSNGHWTEDVIEKELQVVIEESDGSFPTNSYLKKIGRYDLTSAIQSSGGFNYWRGRLGFPIMQNSPNQYNDNDLIDWFGECVEKFGKIPTVEQLKSVDSRKQSAIGRRGGMYRFVCSLVEKDDGFGKYLDDYKTRNGINSLVGAA